LGLCLLPVVPVSAESDASATGAYNMEAISRAESLEPELYTFGVSNNFSGDPGARSASWGLSLDWQRTLADATYLGLGGEYLHRYASGGREGSGFGDLTLRAGRVLLAESQWPELLAELDLSMPAEGDACSANPTHLPVSSASPELGGELRLLKRFHPLTLQLALRGRKGRDYDCNGRRVSPGAMFSTTTALSLWVNNSARVSLITELGYRAETHVSAGVGIASYDWARQGFGVQIELGEHWSAFAESMLGVYGEADGLDLAVYLSYRP
ncbi:MAG: hypothetical protein ACPG4N_01825, partial [Gammaproteobacteria bacterium]